MILARNLIPVWQKRMLNVHPFIRHAFRLQRCQHCRFSDAGLSS